MIMNKSSSNEKNKVQNRSVFILLTITILLIIGFIVYFMFYPFFNGVYRVTDDITDFSPFNPQRAFSETQSLYSSISLIRYYDKDNLASSIGHLVSADDQRDFLGDSFVIGQIILTTRESVDDNGLHRVTGGIFKKNGDLIEYMTNQDMGSFNLIKNRYLVADEAQTDVVFDGINNETGKKCKYKYDLAEDGVKIYNNSSDWTLTNDGGMINYWDLDNSSIESSIDGNGRVTLTEYHQRFKFFGSYSDNGIYNVMYGTFKYEDGEYGDYKYQIGTLMLYDRKLYTTVFEKL
jgi:hypothetical protein